MRIMNIQDSKIISRDKAKFGLSKINFSGNKMRKNIAFSVLALPAFIILLLFQFIPMPGVVLAFKNYDFVNGIFGSRWTGLTNFKFIFSNNDALVALRNTILYNIGFISTVTVGSVILAMLLNEIISRRILKVYQTSIFLPYFLSWAIVAYIVFALFDSRNGMVNGILKNFGSAGVDWYFEPKYWPVIQIIIHFWKYMGYTSLLYYAYVISIDPNYYEAAAIDGANRFQMAIKITLPSLTPIVLITVLMAMGRIFNAEFGQFLMIPMESPMIQGVNSVLDTYVYNALKGSSDIGMGAAAGLLQSAAGFTLVLLVNVFVRNRFGKEMSMF